VISATYQLFFPIEMEDYFQKDIDDREILDSFNLSLIATVLNNVVLFTEEEIRHLDQLQKKVQR
jgi:hypothetical protein